MAENKVNKTPISSLETRHHIEISRLSKRFKVYYAGQLLANSVRVLCLQETNYQPVFYFPREDVHMDLMTRQIYNSYCPYKGQASYWSVTGDTTGNGYIMWGYETPKEEVIAIKNHVAFYCNKVDIQES